MGKPISLLVVGSAWPPETFIARLLRGLLAAGVRVTVAGAQRPSAEWLAQPGFVWLHAPAWEGPAVLRLLRLVGQLGGALGRSPRAVRWLRSARAGLADTNRLLPFIGRRWDVIYFPWNSAAVSYLPLFDLGIPVVLSCRGSQVNIAPLNERRAELRDGLKITFERAAAVHCVSENIRQAAMRWGLPDKRACVIRPAVDADFFTPAAHVLAQMDVFRLVTTGSLAWVKGHEYALLAVRQLCDAGVPVMLTIIGNGPERGRVLYTIDDLGLNDRVRCLGSLSPEEVRAHLHQSDVFLLSSLSEGISNAVLEAMACGLPVVTTDCGGMREAVTDGVEGFVVPVRDPQAMAAALLRLWQETALRQQMGQAGRARVLAEFQLSQQVSDWLTLLKQVTG
jgi:glycosyltransferase involved in cell wall biosynthesis